MSNSKASEKINRVLHVVLAAFLLIGFRVWHLGVVQREEKLSEAQKPKLRTILVRADRGMVYDRFHIPLATNRICYNAAIYYGQIAQIPIASWSADEGGGRIRKFPRKEHIQDLSKVLGEILSLEPARIEDLIHAKASLFPHVPFILKSNLSEKEYYQLKMLEKDWLGVHAEIGSERYYPLGKTGCHLIGTLGSINEKEYSAIAAEMTSLQEMIDSFEGGMGDSQLEDACRRLYELKEKSYTLNDKVGKSGIEAQFEEELRGFWGLKRFEVDQKGKTLRELPGGKPPIPGREIVLTVSAELQQFAEELLVISEKQREGRSLGVDPSDKIRKVQKQPWIKGGAIAALDPKTGEILAFASHPRFDPNDFTTSKTSGKIHRWLESERFIASVWDGHEALTREIFTGAPPKILEEKTLLSWEFYLERLLPKEGALKEFFSRVDDIKSAVQAQEDFEALLYFSKAANPLSLAEALSSKGSTVSDALRAIPEAVPHLKRFDSFFSTILSPPDKLFAIDLCRLAVFSPRFSDDLLSKIGSLKISSYRSLNQAFLRIEKKAKKEAFEEFHAREFPIWREAHQKEFLAEKRKEEKEKKIYAKPYIDYLDRKEKELFETFWGENRFKILIKKLLEPNSTQSQEPLVKILLSLPEDLGEEFLRSFRSFSELDEPLLTNHPRWKIEKDLASAFCPRGGFGFNRSYAYQCGAPQGSLFKLIVSYEAIRQGQTGLSIIDEQTRDSEKIIAYSLNRTPYPRIYKGGRLPKSSSPQIGKIDLIGAIEHSSNPYFSILSGDYFKNPEDLNQAARLFGLGEKSGIELPGETKGLLPSDLKTNRTGLYSYAIGQHTLLTTPIQSALMLAAIANGGDLLKPKIIKEMSGLKPSKEPFSQENRFARKELEAIGIPYPLFTGVQGRTPSPFSAERTTEVRRKIPLPSSIRSQLLEGMEQSVWSGRGSARAAAIKTLLGNPLLMREYLSLKNQMVGKTSTAEILYNPNENPSSKAQIYKHIWFGAISFDADPLAPAKLRWEHPDLVVVVFLRYGDAGKEAAPLAAQMIRKWREIKKLHLAELKSL